MPAHIDSISYRLFHVNTHASDVMSTATMLADIAAHLYRQTCIAFEVTVCRRLYAFEAVGLLLGQEELPADEQQAYIAALLCPLIHQVCC